MNESSRHIETYRQEAEELLVDIEEAILDIEQNPEDEESVNRLFRAIHTIKGSGAMFGFDDIARFSHHVETVLDRVRDGAVSVSKELINLILAACDQIKGMLDVPNGGAEVGEAVRNKIVASLKALLPKAEETGETRPGTEETVRPGIEGEARNMIYRIGFCPHPGIFASGMDPALLLDELRALGECKIVAQTDAVPPLEELNPEECHLSWDIILTTHKGIDAIKDVFIFVEEESQVSIKAVKDETVREVDGFSPRLGDILVERGHVTAGAVKEVVDRQKKIGQLLVESGAVSQDKVESALNEQASINKRKAAARTASVRVPSDKLDNLINLVGEVVITQARLSQVAAAVNDIELAGPVEEVERLTAELRDCVLNIRMLPIGTTFSRFRRLVRDLSAELGKEIDLVTHGGETELDKTVIERLGDPLVHLIRNSIDHGIEGPDERVKAGKPPKGTIRLSAAHRGAEVVIKIEDDGRGLDRERIRERALEKGLISADARLSDKEIFAQILIPGFSTAKEVTKVSGRGVGMDVVKREIDSLRGAIQIAGEKGNGTCITLSLPLTLAIIDGLMVEVAGRSFVLPLALVEECVELGAAQAAMTHGRNMIPVRGELISFIRLRDVFVISGRPPAIEEIAIVQADGFRVGIVVDRVVGDHQTVIKSLGRVYEDADGVSGATILGDGTVALIVDVQGLLQLARREEDA